MKRSWIRAVAAGVIVLQLNTCTALVQRSIEAAFAPGVISTSNLLNLTGLYDR